MSLAGESENRDGMPTLFSNNGNYEFWPNSSVQMPTSFECNSNELNNKNLIQYYSNNEKNLSSNVLTSRNENSIKLETYSTCSSPINNSLLYNNESNELTLQNQNLYYKNEIKSNKYLKNNNFVYKNVNQLTATNNNYLTKVKFDESNQRIYESQQNFDEINSDSPQVDVYRDLILKHLIQDVNSICVKLNLPADPNHWSSENCVKWIEEICAQFQLEIPSRINYFGTLNNGGNILLSMNANDFCDCFGKHSGETLHSQLQLWKTAFEACNPFLKTQIPNTNTQFNDSKILSLIEPIASTSFSVLTQPTFSTYQNCYSNNNPFYKMESNFNYECQNNLNFSNSNNSSSKYFINRTLPSPNDSSSGFSSTSSCAEQDVNEEDYYNKISYAKNWNSLSAPYLRKSQKIEAFNSNNSVSFPPQNYSFQQNSDAPIVSDLNFSNNSQLFEQKKLYNYYYPNINTQNNNIINANNNNETITNQNKFINNNKMYNFQTNVECDYQMSDSNKITPSLINGNGTVHLWHFIRELLDQPKEYSSCVRWVNKEEGTFKIESSHQLARFWGMRKNRLQMNYDKLSRSLRQYYKKGIIQKPEKKQRLVYKFLPPYNL